MMSVLLALYSFGSGIIFYVLFSLGGYLGKKVNFVTRFIVDFCVATFGCTLFALGFWLFGNGTVRFFAIMFFIFGILLFHFIKQRIALYRTKKKKNQLNL